MAERSEFTVHKEKQLVTVYLLGGDTIEGNIFLEYNPGAQTLHQKMAAFLENQSDFFPLSSGGTPAAEAFKGYVGVMSATDPTDGVSLDDEIAF